VWSAILDDFADLEIKIWSLEGAPNNQAGDDIKITDAAPIVRTVDGDLTRQRLSSRWPE
jgi:hypothetical protein